MAIAGEPIEAILKLNTQPFRKDLNGVSTAVTKFKESMMSMGTESNKIANGINTLNKSITSVIPSLKILTDLSAGIKNFNTFANATLKLSDALKTLSSSELSASQSTKNINTAVSSLKGALNGVEGNVKGMSSSIKELSNSERAGVSVTEQWSSAQAHSGRSAREVAMEIRERLDAERQLNSVNQQLISSENQLQAEANQTAVAEEKVAASSIKASSSLNKQSTATRGLGKAMSSLKMMGTMVGSMIAYNFVHNLAMATTETINAKSEMNGYFQMLGYTTRQTQSFNKALDETVQKFPRLNKYALGETISSIGVEFELTTAEMKKAMPVVSMITSEYLRAGRNVNEASLAVKDILQGEFQRLSRETGVKEKDLKEAGWSGDKTDVMGLLEALDKVGKARNWDTFVQKANSLNDAVLILQNRFSEWSADMVERIQPAILGVFNTLMVIGTDFGKAFNGVLDWLSGDGIGQSIVKWGGLATAIVGVSRALITYRTGANLTQIAQMGLRNSILATILGLNAEEVAEHGVTGAVILANSEITKEELANYGRLNSIIAVNTGLKAQEVAEIGKTKALFGSILGLDMATVKEYGFTTALWSNITGVEAETIAMEGWNAQMVLAVTELGVMVSALAVFTGAMVYQAMVISQNTEKYKKFVNMVDKGDDIINEAKDSVSTLTEKKDKLAEKLSTLEKGTYEYELTANKLKTTTDDLGIATQNYADAVSSVAWVKNKQEIYDEEKASAQSKAQREINQALLDYGMNVKDAQQLSNEYWVDALEGWDQHYETLQKVNLQYEKNATSVKDSLNKLNDVKLDDKEVNILIRRKISAGNQVANAKEELGNATGLAEYVDKWLWLQVAQVNNALADFDINQASQGMGEAVSGLLWGLVHALGDNFFGQFGKNLAKDMGLAGKGKGLGDSLKEPINDFIEYVLENGLTLDVGSFALNMRNRLTEWFNSLDILGTIGEIFSGFFTGGEYSSGMSMKQIDIFSILQGLFSLGDGVDFSWATEYINNNIIIPLQTAWNEFMADPLSYIGGVVSFGGIGSLISALMGSDVLDTTWAMTYIQNNIIAPLSEQWNLFMSDPLSYLGGAIMGTGIGGLLNALLGQDDGTSMFTWVNDNIVTPFSNALYTGIMSIPIVGDILALFGLANGENTGASGKGTDLGGSFGSALQTKIGQIPILGDILRMLGVIPQAEPTANSNGHGVGSSISDGLKKGAGNMAQWVGQEMQDIANAISGSVDMVYKVAQDVGGAIWNGINSIIDRHSPGMPSREILAEFGTDIPNSISSSSATAYSTAQTYAQQMYAGMNSVQNDGFGLGGVVDEYQTDAQTVALSSQMMGNDTTTAFNNMQMQVSATTGTMTNDVNTTYTSMQTKQATALTSMKNQNVQAYNDMYLKSNQSLLQMRDSTSNITNQMTKAWTHMKDQIVASANKLKTDSTAHFNQLSSTIGSFYRKIQNPSNWGAGSPNYVRHARKPSVGRSFVSSMKSHRRSGAGVNPYRNEDKLMSIRELMSLVDSNEKVRLGDFLSMYSGGFGWSGWNTTHYNHIKNKSDEWDMKAPMILGKYQAGDGFKVKEFEGGTPKLSFASFVSTAEGLFSQIPYAFYYDSEKWGSWDNAIKHGEANCSDGADALIALAHTFNPSWSTDKVHTTLASGTGHFYAVINGKVMDTTAFQGGHGWGHLGAGIPTRSASHRTGAGETQGKTINITVSMDGATVYGIDDLDSKIQESVQKGLEQEFNDPYTVAI